jgi:hypothetical protein
MKSPTCDVAANCPKLMSDAGGDAFPAALPMKKWWCASGLGGISFSAEIDGTQELTSAIINHQSHF